MNLLILGDVMGASGRKAISNKLPDLIKKFEIDFVIVNGENASDDGKGITKEITETFFKSGNLLDSAFLPEAPMTSPKINKFIYKFLFQLK